MWAHDWPQPPIPFDKLPEVIEVCGGWKEAREVLRGWVLVPRPDVPNCAPMSQNRTFAPSVYVQD